MTTVKMEHIRAVKLCSSGVRTFFQQQGFDWTDFLTNGIPAEKLEATGNPIIMRAVKVAQEEVGRGR